jgi:hypothetical protein
MRTAQQLSSDKSLCRFVLTCLKEWSRVEFYQRKKDQNPFSKLDSTGTGAKRLRISGHTCRSSFNCD